MLLMRFMRKLILFFVALGACVTSYAQTKSGSNSSYYPLFGPLTFYHSVAQKHLSFTDAQNDEELSNEVSAALMRVYLNRPDLVRFSENEMDASGLLREDLEKPIQQQVAILDEANDSLPEVLPEQEAPMEVVVEKPHFWKYLVDGSLQFMQNYVSDNWYKGGESNYAAVGALTLEANYDNKSRWKWDNKLEMKLGLQTSPSDTVNKFKPNEDLIRYTGKVGLQAVRRWYYALQVLAYTQFMPGLRSNNKSVFSDFMSPFTLNVGLGMDYKVEALNKRLTGTVNISPFGLDYRYVDRENLAKSFGIRVDEGHLHSKVDFGSTLTASLEWKFNDVIWWKTRLYIFTSYHRVQAEWENTFTLRVSKFITANLFLYPRFDDANNRDEKLGYWQFKEYSSLGFAFKL